MQWIAYLFCSIFIFVGLWLSVISYRGIHKAKQLNSWPTVEARIAKTDLEFVGDGASSEVIVEYNYTVNGKEYTNNQIHPGYSSSSADGHRALFNKIKNCSLVRARYNEVNPQESYLITGAYSFHWPPFFGGLIFFFVGLMFLFIFHFAMTGSFDYSNGLDIIK